MTRLKSLLFSILLFSVVGCGSSTTSEFVGQTNPVGGTTVNQVFGRAILDSPAIDATVEITDLENQSLGFPTAEVDATGNFRINTGTRPLPAEFRVRLIQPTDSVWNLPLVANVREYSSDKVVYCNILTTLAALHRERTGGTQEESVRWVKRLFAIPESVHPGYGIEESRQSAFRHSVFLLQAERNGGVRSYVQALVNSEPVANQTLATTLIVGLGTTIGKSVLNKVVGEVVGLVAQSLGINTGNNAEIEQALEQLSEIQAGIERLETEIQDDFNRLSSEIRALAIYTTFVSQTVALEPVLSSVQVQTNNLTTTAANTPITNEPAPRNQDVSNLVTELQAFDSQTVLAQISDNLAGENGLTSLLSLYRQLLSFRLGVPPSGSSVWKGSPVITNQAIVYPLEALFKFYENQQTLALNILAETANSSFSPTIIAEAQTSARLFNEGLVFQQQLLRPALASDFFLSVPGLAFEERTKSPNPSAPSGTLFYTQVQGETLAYHDIETFTSAFDKTVLTLESDSGQTFLQQTLAFQAANLSSDWRLPSLDELNYLRTLALQSDSSNVSEGLKKLGFQLPPEWTGKVWYNDQDENNINGSIFITGGFRLILTGRYPVKLYDFQDGSRFGYMTEEIPELLQTPAPYIQVHLQNFESDQPISEVVAAGFRPTESPTLELAADGSRVVATIGDQDVTEMCLWKSSDSVQLGVGNVAENAGVLTWHPRSDRTLQSQTVTASLPGMDGSSGEPLTLQSSITVEVPTPAPVRVLEAILIDPSNLAVGNLDTIFYKAIGYYSDQSVADITNLVDWSLELPDGSDYPSDRATIDVLSVGALVFSAPITENDIVIRASLDGVDTTTRLQVAVSP